MDARNEARKGGYAAVGRNSIARATMLAADAASRQKTVRQNPPADIGRWIFR
jgi:hypothetical protein